MKSAIQHDIDLRLSAEHLYEAVAAQHVVGLITWRDVERARAMRCNELAAHVEVLTYIAQKVHGTEKAVERAQDNIIAFVNSRLFNGDEFQDVMLHWVCAHREPPPLVAA